MTGAWDEIGCKLVDEVIARVEVVDDVLALADPEFDPPEAVTVNGPVDVGDVIVFVIVDSNSMFWTANKEVYRN